MEKNSFYLYLSSFTALNKKGCLQQIQIFLWIFFFSNLFRKTHFLIISELLSEIIFLTKKRIFRKLARKCFKTTGMHSLAVCGLFRGEKQFLLIFVPFYCFEQKGLFTTYPNFPLDLLLFKLVEKKTFWLFQNFFEIVVFLLKREFFSEFPQKCFKTQKRIV